MIFKFAVSRFCVGGDHATITVTTGGKSVVVAAQRSTLRDIDAGDREVFVRVLLRILAQSVPGDLDQAKLSQLDGKQIVIDVTKLEAQP